MELTLVVPAAGKGTRLLPNTRDLPKGMIPVAGRPILDYVLVVGSTLPLDRIVLIIGLEGQAVIDHFGPSYRDVPITYVTQHEPQGLTHAVSLAEPYVRDLMLVLLSDELYLGSRHHMLERSFLKNRADGLCGFVRTKEPEHIRRNYGLELDRSDKILRLVEKPPLTWNDLLGTGTWLFRREFFDFIRQTPVNMARGERDFVAVIQQMVYKGKAVYGVDLGGDYVNINAAEDLAVAEILLEKHASADRSATRSWRRL